MIVRCERCETRFKLDESRLPARGARVRCSRCKHAFFVLPPAATEAERVHAAAEAAAQSPSPTPEVAWDLDDGPGATPDPGAARDPAADAEGSPEPEGEAEAPDSTSAGREDESDWHFERDVPGLGESRPGADLRGDDLGDGDLRDSGFGDTRLGASGADPAARTGGAPLPEPDPNESSFAGLGDPETWDLLSSTSPPDATAARRPPEPPSRSAPEPALEPLPSLAAAPEAPAPGAGAEPAPAAARAPAPSEPRTAEVEAAPAAARAAGAPVRLPHRIAGWSAVLVLSAWIAASALRPPVPVAAPARIAPVAGLEVAALRPRLVDNLTAGPVLVVSGALRNAGPAPRALGTRLEVRLIDASGRPLPEAAAPVGPALAADRLRLEDPDVLRGEQAARARELAARRLAPGDELAFDAIFATPPHGAARAVLVAAPHAATP